MWKCGWQKDKIRLSKRRIAKDLKQSRQVRRCRERGVVSEQTYESYPFSTVCLSMLQTVLSYVLGALIFYFAGGILLGFGYIVLCLIVLLLSMRFRCTFCYYYGKKCPSGLGRLSKSLFSKRDAADFANPRNVSIVAIPSFGLLFLPLVVGLVFVFIRFSWLLLFLFIAYFLIAISAGFPLRKDLLCKHCRQGEIGCPAYEGMKGKK